MAIERRLFQEERSVCIPYALTYTRVFTLINTTALFCTAQQTGACLLPGINIFPFRWASLSEAHP